LPEIAIETAYINGLAKGGEPILYDREQVYEKLGFVYENGIGGIQGGCWDLL